MALCTDVNHCPNAGTQVPVPPFPTTTEGATSITYADITEQYTGLKSQFNTIDSNSVCIGYTL